MRKRTTMSYLNRKNDVKVKRLPLTDKTNRIPMKENSTLPRRSTRKDFTTIDPKLQSKIHGRIIDKTLSSTLKPSQSRKVTNDHLLNDWKCKSTAKVHLERLNNENVMLKSQKKHARVRKISTNSNKQPLEESMHKCVPKEGNEVNVSINHGCTEVSDLEKNNPISAPIEGQNIKSTSSNFYKKVQINKCKELDEAVKSNDKPQEAVKKVHFTDDVNLTPKFDKALRKRRTKNYVELSLTETPKPEKKLEQSDKKHVPVYLQSAAPNQMQRDNDPFEFVPESPSGGLKKQKRRRGPITETSNSDSDSSVYDKSMHNILKKVRLKLSPKKNKKIKPTNIKKTNNAQVVSNQMKKGQTQIVPSKSVRRKNLITELNRNKPGSVVSNSKVKAGPTNMQKQIPTKSKEPNRMLNDNQPGATKARNQRTLQLLTKEMQNMSRRISRITSYNIEIGQKTSACDKYFGFDDDFEDDFNNISQVLPERGSSGMKTFSSIKPVTTSQRFISLTSTPLPNSECRLTETKNQTSPKRINIISNILLSPLVCPTPRKQLEGQKLSMPAPVEKSTVDSSCAASLIEDDGDLLGFEDSVAPSTSAGLNPKTSTQHFKTPIHDYFDSVRHQSNVTESGFRGFANVSSTINANIMKRRISGRSAHPWRSDRLNIRRNPHFLAMKDTSLPCYNQEMILEAKLLERPKTPTLEEQTKANTTQKSILDYVTSNRVNNESTPTKKHSMSLFDDADFSPIKNKSPLGNSSPTKNSQDENYDRLQTLKGKKNILGLRRKKTVTSPLKERNVKEFGVENYFGFDSPDIQRAVGKENVRVTRSRVKLANNEKEEALPMRVPLKQLNKVRKEAVEELLDIIDLENDVAKELEAQEIEDVPNEKSQDEDVPHVGLFEDLEELQPPARIYGRKRAKRTRAVSVDTDIVEEDKPRRKRKEMQMTPAEEEEFNRWADEFNAMCDEVERHDLETV